MPLEHKGLKKVKMKEKTAHRAIEQWIKEERSSSQQNLAGGTTFKVLNIVFIRKASKMCGVLQSRIARKESFGLEVVVICNYFNCKKKSGT